MTQLPLPDLLALAVEAARAGGRVLLAQRRGFTVRTKGLNDFVTDADLAAQTGVHETLHRRFPDFGFLGEEGGKENRAAKTDGGPRWIVDPLDGTTNYVHDLPFFAVSIGLEWQGQLQVGVVYDPSHDELFSAARSLGAFRNGQAIRVSAAEKLKDCLMASAFPADLRGKDYVAESWRHFGVRAAGLRRTGSTALNLAYLAAGRFDAFYAYEVNSWDVAGGLLLVEEAGGRFTNRTGGPYALHGPEPLLVSNGKVHAELLSEFGKMP